MPTIHIPSYAPDRQFHDRSVRQYVQYGPAVERYDCAVWNPGSVSDPLTPGVICSRRWDGVSSPYRETETDAEFGYKRVMRAQALGEAGLWPFLDAVGIYIEEENFADPQPHRMLTMRLPASPDFVDRANCYLSAQPSSGAMQKSFGLVGGCLYSRADQFGALSEGQWLISSDKFGTHDMADHGLAFAAAPDPLLPLLADTARFWLTATPNVEMPEPYLIHRHAGYFMDHIENGVRPDPIIALRRGDISQVDKWAKYLRTRSGELLGRERVREILCPAARPVV